jgi:hypothetical protein
VRRVRRAERQRDDALLAAVDAALVLAGAEPDQLTGRDVDVALGRRERHGALLNVEHFLLVFVRVKPVAEAIVGREFVVVQRQVRRAERVGERANHVRRTHPGLHLVQRLSFHVRHVVANEEKPIRVRPTPVRIRFIFSRNRSRPNVFGRSRAVPRRDHTRFVGRVFK